MSPEIAARLERLEIQLAAQTKDYWLLVRENCMALVQAGENGAASIGSSGIMTEEGLAYLVWREGRALLAAHGGKETPATAEQSAAVTRFSEDLQQAFQPDAIR